MTAAAPMRFDITHRTAYSYGTSVQQSYHLLRLSPRQVDHQTIIRHRLSIMPRAQRKADHVDYFGNPFCLVRIEQDHNVLVVTSESEIEVRPTDPIDLAASSNWRDLVAGRFERRRLNQYVDVVQFAAASRHGRCIAAAADYARPSFPDDCPVLVGVLDLTRRIFEDFSFDTTATDVSTPVEKVLETRRGVCQDFAHLQISALRSLGLPARYVSGYILTRPPEGQERLQGADASHAWISVWAPETGWVDFDPTNNIIPRGEHITIAYGRDYDDVAPISGVLLGGGAHSVDVGVDVVAIDNP